MTTEEAKKKKEGILNGEGSPITVGGGGGIGETTVLEGPLSCVFDERDYPDPEPGGPPKKKPFRHPGWRIKTFKILTTRGLRDYSDLLPSVGQCTIEVSCHGSRDDVTIYGNDFGINMDTGTYSQQNGNSHTNPNAESYISNVVLNTGSNLHNLGPFNKNDQCSVCTDHIPNSPHCR